MSYKDFVKLINIDFDALSRPNLWSYLSLAGSNVMLMKAKGESGEKISEEKQKILEYVIERTHLSADKIKQILGNIQQALLSCGYGVRRVKIKALSPALIGGSEVFSTIPFEVGLHFDPFLNVPYIPGSTIKGAVRNAAFDLLLRDNASEEEAEKECKRLFGDNRNVGLIGFSSAYPIEGGLNGRLLYPDVMTPHYTGETDTELDVSPNPIIYPSIAQNTVFQFYLFYRKDVKSRRITIEASRNADLADIPTQEITKLGIVDLAILYSFYKGVGAKTAVGYSRFEVLSYEALG